MKHRSSTAAPLTESPSPQIESGAAAARRPSSIAWSAFPVFQILAATFCVWYGYIFWKRVSPYWFNHAWTTDDALQQTYPFYKILHPGLFDGDLITKMMECYLAPIHYGITYVATVITKNPILAGHWVMLVQMIGALLFMFLAVRRAAGIVPAFLSVAWLLHTRHIMQRITCGLPRGWSAPLLTAYLYFALAGQMNAILGVIFIGCLLHPPSTLIIAVSHGLFLLWKFYRNESRAEYKVHLIRYLVLAPLFALLTLSVVRMPPEIGTMASYETASQMPEFINPGGRFPFTPFRPAWTEIRSFGFQAFMGRLHNPGPFWKAWLPTTVMMSMAALVVVGFLRRKVVFPAPLWCFIAGSLCVYFASRYLAFRLYVPDRHIQFPFGIFFIAAFSIGAWRAFEVSRPPLHRILSRAGIKAKALVLARSQQLASVAALILVGLLVYTGSGLGLQGAMNFNWVLDRRGGSFDWIRDNTPMESIIAGEPTLIDPVQLFGQRVGYVTTETSHPFYDKYYAEMKRRLVITLQAHYARNLKELLMKLEPEGIDFFVFDPSKFSKEALANSKYFEPFNSDLRKMTTRTPSEFAFEEAKTAANSGLFPPLVFRDRLGWVIDLKKLRGYLEAKGQI